MNAHRFLYVIMALLAALLFGACDNTTEKPATDNAAPDDTGGLEVTDEGEFITAGNASGDSRYGGE